METAHGIYKIGLVYKLVGHAKSVQGLVAVGDQVSSLIIIEYIYLFFFSLIMFPICYLFLDFCLIWSASSSGIIRVNSATVIISPSHRHNFTSLDFIYFIYIITLFISSSTP